MRILTKGTHLAMHAVAMFALLMYIGQGSAIASAQSLPEFVSTPSSVFLAQETAGTFPAGDSLVLRSSWTRWNAPTLILQPVLGTAVGFAGLVVGFGAALSVRECGFGGCNVRRTTTTDILEFASIYGFTMLGVATGISLGGDIAGADGNFGLILAGTAVGLGLGTGILALPNDLDPARGIAAYLVLIASPIVAYNLTAEAEPLPPPPDPNAPEGRPDYLRPHRGASHSALPYDTRRNLSPTGAGQDWQELTFNIPLPALRGEQ